MYMCVYVYTYIYIYIYTHLLVLRLDGFEIRSDVLGNHPQTKTYAGLDPPANQTTILTYIHVHIYIYIYIYIYMYIYIYTHIYIYIYITHISPSLFFSSSSFSPCKPANQRTRRTRPLDRRGGLGPRAPRAGPCGSRPRTAGPPAPAGSSGEFHELTFHISFSAHFFLLTLCAGSSSPQISPILVGNFTLESDSLRKSPQNFRTDCAETCQNPDSRNSPGSRSSLLHMRPEGGSRRRGRIPRQLPSLLMRGRTSTWIESAGLRHSEGGMIRLETLIQLKLFTSSCSSYFLSYWN